ncbi:MAG: ACT domain-containing protein [Clostridia bacterium]|nr:ACT domain-containing protein [Clostridia bacterium]
MTIKQISVFIENKPGVMVTVTEALGKAGIDIRALSLADTQDFGILRMIATDTAKAKAVLNEVGCVTSVTDVIAAAVPDKPGAMTEILNKISETGLNIEYIYAFVSPKNKKAYIVLRIKDIDSALIALKDKGIELAEDPSII